jgi:hypothetical protein
MGSISQPTYDGNQIIEAFVSFEDYAEPKTRFYFELTGSHSIDYVTAVTVNGERFETNQTGNTIQYTQHESDSYTPETTRWSWARAGLEDLMEGQNPPTIIIE